MKPVTQLSNVEKGKVLAQLLPHLLPTIIEAIKTMAKKTIDEADEVRKSWTMPFINPNHWIAEAEAIYQRMEQTQYMVILNRGGSVFAEELFTEPINVMLSIHAIAQHINSTVDVPQELENAFALLWPDQIDNRYTIATVLNTAASAEASIDEAEFKKYFKTQQHAHLWPRFRKDGVVGLYRQLDSEARNILVNLIEHHN